LCHGIELSANWHGRSIHIVGLNIDLGCGELLEAIRTQQETRLGRAELIAARLAKLGFEGTLEGARAVAGNDNIGRPHFAKYLVSIRAVRDERQAFRKLLGRGKPGDVQRCWPNVRTVVSWIRHANGTPVLAHPAHYKLTNAKLGILTDEFIDSGGEALEVVSGKQAPGLTRKLSDLAIAKKLLASTGSDFHRPGNSWSEVGAQSAIPGHLTPVWDAW
jgi:predicted metal-dependent phosphoesterase TrpH